MIKFFTNKKIWEKVLLALIFVILFQFAVMEPVRADVVEFGGKLISPILSLLVSLGDGVMDVLHSSIMGTSNPLLHAQTDSDWWDIFKNIIAAVVTAACVIGAIVASGGLALFLGGVALISAGSFYFTGESILVDIGENTTKAVASLFGAEMLPEELYLPAYSYSPEEIFKGNILLFNVDFFGEPIEIQQKTHEDEETGDEIVDYWYYIDEDGNEVKTSKQNSAEILQSTISTWYNAIRNIALVIMLSVLVYIGIRILLTSVASEKAKYLTMLKDWFVGLCLLFLMHYIMAFSVTLVNKLTDLVNSSSNQEYYEVALEGTDGLKESLEELKLAGEDAGDLNIEYDADGDGEDEYVWSTNLMGYLRTSLQMESPGGQYIGQAICFLVLVVFTVMFTFTYLRRLLYMAFLTLIAPVVALTYCIDKLNDGSAQGFNKWIKEYIFNLLIQPMHLLLYFVLVSSAFDTLGDNFIYSIVAIGFMIPAEKLLRSLFGFEKASTPGALGGAAAAGLMMSGVNKLVGMASKGQKGSKGEGGSNSGGSTSDNGGAPIRTNDIDSTDQMLNGDMQNNGIPERTNEAGSAVDREKEALDRYKAEGYGQNANGEYFNPWTDEYDADYDPTKDETYNPMTEEEKRSKEALDKYKAEGYDQNANGEYFNPWTDEYDADYDPTKDKTYNSLLNVEEQSDNNPQNIEQNENTDSNSVTPNRGRFRRRAGRKLKAFGAATKVGLKTGAKRKLKAIPRFGKGLILGGAVGAAAAAAGTVAAVAAGDPGKVGTALAVGAGGGYAAGRAAANSKFSDSISPEVKEAYNRRYNAPEYKEEMMEDHIKGLKKDENIRQKLTTELGRGATRDMMKEGGHFEQFVRNGVDDIDDIIAAETLIRDGVFNNVDHATAVIQNDKRMGRKDPNKMSKKTRSEWEDTFKEEYMNAGANEEKANDTVDKTMNLVHVLHQAKTGSYNRSAVNDRRTGNRRTTRNTGAGRRTRNSNNTNSSESGNNSSDNGNSSN